MIVEFIGCSGAGKTSLAKEVRRRSNGSRAILSVDPAPELAIDTVLDLGSGEFKHVTAS